MTLVVDLFDPERGAYAYLNAIPDDAAGFEVYRAVLWGSEPLVARGARFFPQLRDADLWVFPDELEAFAAECRMVDRFADSISRELSGQPDADHIRRYINRFLRAVDLARARGAGVCIS